jgi:hypothetical protein
LIKRLKLKALSLKLKVRAIAIKQRTNVGGLLVEDLTKAEANISPESVEKIEQTIERSRIVLDTELEYSYSRVLRKNPLSQKPTYKKVA